MTFWADELIHGCNGDPDMERIGDSEPVAFGKGGSLDEVFSF